MAMVNLSQEWAGAVVLGRGESGVGFVWRFFVFIGKKGGVGLKKMFCIFIFIP